MNFHLRRFVWMVILLVAFERHNVAALRINVYGNSNGRSHALEDAHTHGRINNEQQGVPEFRHSIADDQVDAEGDLEPEYPEHDNADPEYVEGDDEHPSSTTSTTTSTTTTTPKPLKSKWNKRSSKPKKSTHVIKEIAKVPPVQQNKYRIKDLEQDGEKPSTTSEIIKEELFEGNSQSEVSEGDVSPQSAERDPEADSQPIESPAEEASRGEQSSSDVPQEGEDAKEVDSDTVNGNANGTPVNANGQDDKQLLHREGSPAGWGFDNKFRGDNNENKGNNEDSIFGGALPPGIANFKFGPSPSPLTSGLSYSPLTNGHYSRSAEEFDGPSYRHNMYGPPPYPFPNYPNPFSYNNNNNSQKSQNRKSGYPGPSPYESSPSPYSSSWGGYGGYPYGSSYMNPFMNPYMNPYQSYMSYSNPWNYPNFPSPWSGSGSTRSPPKNSPSPSPWAGPAGFSGYSGSSLGSMYKHPSYRGQEESQSQSTNSGETKTYPGSGSAGPLTNYQSNSPFPVPPSNWKSEQDRNKPAFNAPSPQSYSGFGGGGLGDTAGYGGYNPYMSSAYSALYSDPQKMLALQYLKTLLAGYDRSPFGGNSNPYSSNIWGGGGGLRDLMNPYNPLSYFNY